MKKLLAVCLVAALAVPATALSWGYYIPPPLVVVPPTPPPPPPAAPAPQPGPGSDSLLVKDVLQARKEWLK